MDKFDLELHTRRIHPVNSKLMARYLITIELIDSPLSICTFLEHKNSKPHTGFRFAVAYVINISRYIPHQQWPELVEQLRDIPFHEAWWQVAYAHETAQELAMNLGSNSMLPRTRGAFSFAFIRVILPIDMVVRAPAF